MPRVSQSAVDAVTDPLTLQLGPGEVLLNLAVDFRDTPGAHEVEQAVARLSSAIRERHPDVQHIYLSATSLARARKAR